MPFGLCIKEGGALGLHEKPRIDSSFVMPTQGYLSLVRQKQQKKVTVRSEVIKEYHLDTGRTECNQIPEYSRNDFFFFFGSDLQDGLITSP